MHNPSDAIALDLFNHYALTIDGTMYRIAEAEIYFHSLTHPDPFCHQHPEQARYLSSYFHYSGFDVTFGNDKAFIGALIRGVVSMEGEYLYGPGRVAYHWKPKRKRTIKLLPTQTPHPITLAPKQTPYAYDHTLLTLPRVNLSADRMLKALSSKDPTRIAQMQEALHRKARYLRLPAHFATLRHKPDDLKSIITEITSKGIL